MTQPGPGGHVTDRTRVALTISSWYHVGVILVFLTGLYFAIRGDVNAAIVQGAKNAHDIGEAQESIIRMRMDIVGMADDLKFFRAQYERDMDRYIRDDRKH